MPPGESGRRVAIGSTSFPMHISAKTKQPDLAAAYLDWITGPDAGQELVDTQQVPAATDGDRRARRPARQGGQGRVGPARRGRRPDAVPGLVVADDAADDGPVVPGDAGGRASPQDVIERMQERLGGVPPGARGGLAAWRRSRHAGCAVARTRRAGRRSSAKVRVRAPGEPRRVAYLYLAPAFVFYLLFAFGPLVYTTWLSFFDWDGLTVGHVGRARQLRQGPERPGHPRVVRPLVRADPVLRGAALLARAGARVGDRAQPGARRDVLPRRAVPAADDRHRGRGDRVGVDLRAGRAAQRGARRRRARAASRAAGWATSTSRCRRSASSARG